MRAEWVMTGFDGSSGRRPGGVTGRPRKAPLDAVAKKLEGIRTSYGVGFFNDLMTVIADNFSGGDTYRAGSVAEHLLGWLAADTHGWSGPLAALLAAPGATSISEPQAIQMEASAVERWVEHVRTRGVFADTTSHQYGRVMARILQHLGELPDRGYPPFQERFISIPEGKTTSPSLAALEWPELEGLDGAARNRQAIGLVRRAALEKFEVFERAFRFGQATLSAGGAPAGVDEAAWQAVRRLLVAERESWMTTGLSQFDPTNKVSGDVEEILGVLRWRTTWSAAGLHLSSGDGIGRVNKVNADLVDVALLARACIGPTMQATLAFMLVFCCDTGWNRQPIQDLPRSPLLFRTASDIGVATSAFASSFKNRAGHEVLAYLDRGAGIGGLAEERIRAVWKSTAENLDPNGQEDGYTILHGDRDGSLIDLIGRYGTMLDAVRPFPCTDAAKDAFCVSLRFRHGLDRVPADPLARMGWSGVLSRDGLSFPAIRNSYLAVKLREVGSVAATRPFAGHVGQRVLMAHYLNSADIQAELDESIRFFQNACQSLLVSGRPDAAVTLTFPPDTIVWFARLAKAAGIAAAVGLDGNPTPEGRPRALVFHPTEDNLRDLFLHHWALRRVQGRVPPGRWKVQALPLLAAVKAIGGQVCARGLRPAYLAAARRAHRDLAAGVVALPPIMEN